MKNALTGQELTNDEIHEIAIMCHNQRRLEAEIAASEESLSAMNERLRNLSEVQIPEAMMAMGLTELKLSTGESVSIKKYYSTKIPTERLNEAMEWLRKTGNDDIIKNTISLNFGKGEDELAQEVAKLLIQKGLSPEQKIFVHAMTLKAFVKECIEGGRNLPLDLFGVFVGNKTKITPAK